MKKDEKELLAAIQKAMDAFKAVDKKDTFGVIIIGVARNLKNDEGILKMMATVAKPAVPRLLRWYADYLAKSMN